MLDDLILIENTKLLSDEKFSKLSELKNKVIAGYENRILFRADYLMRVSVLDDVKHPTADAKYWQANLERSVMYQNLIDMSFNYIEIESDIEIKNALVYLRKQEKTPLAFAKTHKLEIQIKRLQARLASMKKEADDRMREIIGWTTIMNELEPLLEFPKDDPEQYMAKSYPLRFARQKAMIGQIGASDMNGAMNILGLCETAFKNPQTLKLLEEEEARAK
jgi:hypothetical protein